MVQFGYPLDRTVWLIPHYPILRQYSTRMLISGFMPHLLVKLWKEGSFRRSSSGQMSAKVWKWADPDSTCPDERIGTHKVGYWTHIWEIMTAAKHPDIEPRYQNWLILKPGYPVICRNSTITAHEAQLLGTIVDWCISHCGNVVLETFENSLAMLLYNYIVNFEQDGCI